MEQKRRGSEKISNFRGLWNFLNFSIFFLDFFTILQPRYWVFSNLKPLKPWNIQIIFTFIEAVDDTSNQDELHNAKSKLQFERNNKRTNTTIKCLQRKLGKHYQHLNRLEAKRCRDNNHRLIQVIWKKVESFFGIFFSSFECWNWLFFNFRWRGWQRNSKMMKCYRLHFFYKHHRYKHRKPYIRH